MSFQLTLITKAGGPLTKRISLTNDGALRSDGGACVMSQGWGERLELSTPEQLAELIERLGSDQALAGPLRPDLPNPTSRIGAIFCF